MYKLSNLPSKFSVSILNSFDFGGPDGKDDSLLETCALITDPINEFLEENKSIIVGDRGTGKTAIFRLLSEKKIKFKTSGKYQQIYVAIDEDLGYKTLREHVSTQIQDSTRAGSAQHRIVWELFFLSRCLEAISQKMGTNPKFIALRDRFYKAVGWNSQQKIGLLDVLLHTKKTFGVKLEGGHLGYVIPNFYTSLESKAPSELPLDSSQMLDLPSIKSDLDRLLAESKIVIYLLVDKIDEFVSGEDYETQRQMLQALIQCWRDYQAYPRVKIKLFLRRDLYERLDFSAIGRDKIDPKKVELKWSEEDIRKFVAMRILHNIAPHLNNRTIRLECDEANLKISKSFLKEIRALDSIPEHEIPQWKRLRRWILRFRAKLSGRKLDEYDARTTSFQDIVCQSIMTLFLPRLVNHLNRSCKQETMSIVEYFSTHFQFATGLTTPRVVLSYLQKCLEHAKAYYRKNPNQSLSSNEKGEFPLFLRDHLSEAYTDIRLLSLQTVVGLHPDWNRPAVALLQFMNKSRNPDQIAFKDARKHISKMLDPGGSAEILIQFFAFYEHVGLFKCTNRTQRPEERNYHLPIFFQQVPLSVG